MSIIQQTIVAERQQYAELYTIILSEVAQIFYVGGALACKLKRGGLRGPAADLPKLVKQFDQPDEFALELYGCSKCPGHNHSFIETLRQIADKLYAYLVAGALPHFILVKTDIPYQKYTILLDDSRTLATFYELSEQFIQTILSGQIGAKNRQAVATEQHFGLRLLPTKAQLVDIYRDLASPQPDLWEIQLPRMRDLLKITGADDDRPDATAAEESRTDIINKFIANNTNIVLLGDHAMQLRHGKPFRNRIIQLLAIDPTAMAKDISIGIQPSAITSTTEAIMRDRRLQRTSIRAHGVDLVHIYHNLTYDVIGFDTKQYRNKQIQIGSTPVLARFILIDYWLLVGKFAQGRVPESFFQAKKTEILEHFDNIAAVSLDDIPPPSNFIGQYVSDAEYAKQVRKDINFPPYYPTKTSQ